MNNLVEIVNTLAGWGTIVSLAAIVLGLYAAATKKPAAFFAYVHKNALAISFALALVSVLGSLFYSIVAGYPPCVLCWWQRVFLFPQVILLGLAVWKKNSRILPYAFSLSIVGGAIALYQTYIQYGGSDFFSCDSAPGAISCTARYVYELGFVTIPLMSLAAFGLLITVGIISRRA